jgi:hypothetical protein
MLKRLNIAPFIITFNVDKRREATRRRTNGDKEKYSY